MESPRFLTEQQVVALHAQLVQRYGGDPGVRDIGLLRSAIAQPAAMYDGAWLHADLFEMAAAYHFHLVSNHPCVDGNQRIGAACAIVFLAVNGVELEPDEAGLVEITLRVARGEAEKSDVAAFLRARAR